MKNERGANHDHTWVCQQRDGAGGELVTFRPLSPVGIDLINQDPVNTEKVCPGGVVRCSGCPHYFNEGEKNKDVLPKRLLSQKLVTFKPPKPPKPPERTQ